MRVLGSNKNSFLTNSYGFYKQPWLEVLLDMANSKLIKLMLGPYVKNVFVRFGLMFPFNSVFSSNLLKGS